MYNPRDGRWRKQQERETNEFTSKLENDGYGDPELQPSTSTTAAQGRSTPECQQQQHPPPSPPSQTHKLRATSAAWDITIQYTMVMLSGRWAA